MVKKEVKGKEKEVKVKKTKSNKTNKNTSEDKQITCESRTTKQKKTKKQSKKTHQVVESEEEYKLPKPSFECNDDNVEQALSASFIDDEKNDQQTKGSVVSTKTQIAAEESKKKTKSKEKSLKLAVAEKKAVKRKQNKENDDVETKKKRAKVNTKSIGGKKRKQNENDEVTVNSKETTSTNLQKGLGNIRVEPGTISITEPKRQRVVNVPAEPKQQGRSKRRKTNTVEMEKNQTREVKSNDSTHSEGQIFLNASNLPSGCDTDALNFFFNESDLYPQINLKKKSVTVENEKGEKRRRNVNKGSAILVCKSQAEADAILKLDGVTITSVTGEESEIKISLKESSDPIESATKLYIGGLHPKIPEEELKEALESEGISLMKVKRVCWKGTKRHKGYGFIWLPTPEDVKKALAAKIMLEGKELVIMHCK